MKLLPQYLAVACAGAVGSMARLALGTVCGRLFTTTFPVGTFIINITGSLFLGWFATLMGERIGLFGKYHELVRVALAVGFVGAYTTFSTFMYESNLLFQDGSDVKALMNLALSLVLGLIAVQTGTWLAR